MGQILLTPEEIRWAIFQLAKERNPDIERYFGDNIDEWLKLVIPQEFVHKAMAKAQLKKVMTDAPWKIGIGIRFLSEEEYQDLLEEVGLEG